MSDSALIAFGMLAGIVAAGLPAPAAAAPESAYEVVEQEIRIPMPDGVELHACLSLPQPRAEGERFPALLTTDPYAGACGRWDRHWYQEFAPAGFAVAYVHVRGTGLSGGRFPTREYSEQELQDAVDLIAWLAEQPWSSGRVGMFGASWSGFNALQVAMRGPPALGAIGAFVATENLYHEDVHYPDGILTFSDYNVMADLRLMLVPAPGDPLDTDTLDLRFDEPPWSLMYLREQRDGAFWRSAQRFDRESGAIQVPVLVIGGWYDGYRSAALRAFERLTVPVRAIIGPWDHGMQTPLPTADLGEATIRWWRHWLKDEGSSGLEESRLTAFLRRPHTPATRLGAVPGEWQAFAAWPPAGLEMLPLFPDAERRLARTAGREGEHHLRYVASGGSEAGVWWGDTMPDQRVADAHSLVFESAPLERELRLLGRPKLCLRVAADAPRANWIARLSDVSPDGVVALVTGAGRNSSHRESAAAPRFTEPGTPYEIEIDLHATSWIFERGHRIRLAVSNALWPMFWPSPSHMVARVLVGEGSGTELLLPLVPEPAPGESEAAAHAVGSTNLGAREAARAEPLAAAGWIGPAHLTRDVVTGRSEAEYEQSGLSRITVRYEVDDQDPARARVRGEIRTPRTWRGEAVVLEGITEIRSDVDNFVYRHERRLLRNDTPVRERRWEAVVPRDHQ